MPFFLGEDVVGEKHAWVAAARLFRLGALLYRCERTSRPSPWEGLFSSPLTFSWLRAAQAHLKMG